MIIAPVIFCTVVHGVAGMNDMRKVGRVALKALVYFELVTTVALALALLAVNLFKPGAGMNVDLRHVDVHSVAAYAAQAHQQTVADFLLHIIPATYFSAFTQSDVLQVLLVSVLTAFALTSVGEAGRPLLAGIEAAAQVVFKIVGFIMWAAPIGAAHMMKPTILNTTWAAASMPASSGRPASPTEVRAKAVSTETSSTCSTSLWVKAEK